MKIPLKFSLVCNRRLPYNRYGRNFLLGGKLSKFIVCSIGSVKVPGARSIFFFKKRLWEVQARKMIIKEGLDCWVSGGMPRGVIRNTFLKFIKPMCLICCKFSTRGMRFLT